VAPLLAVDAPSLLFRAFHALPKSITDGEGRPVNALLGTANMLLQVVQDHEPRAVALCFGPDAADYRVELFDGYHAERPPVPAELAPQFVDAGVFYDAFGWNTVLSQTLEADDLLGSLARIEAEAGGEALVLTGDRDMFQCASERVKVLYVRTGVRGAQEVGPDEVRERYGVDPGQVPDFIALRGDPSDGIPGAKGIGEKTAAQILRRYGTLEDAIDAAEPDSVLSRMAAELSAFKQIATLQQVDLERPEDRATDYAGGARAARERAMNRLAERLERMAAEGAG
jgi:DNA polymerase-1